MSATPLPEVLTIWYAEHISHLQAALGVPVALVENNPDRDYGALPGPPCRLVLRAELVEGRTLNAYRDYSGGLPSDPDAAAGWSVCVHRWTPTAGPPRAHYSNRAPTVTATAPRTWRPSPAWLWHRRSSSEHEKTRPQ